MKSIKEINAHRGVICSHLNLLSCKHYLNGEKLLKYNWISWQPVLDFIYEIATEEDFIEYKVDKIDCYMGQIGNGSYDAKLWKERLKQSRLIEKEHPDNWGKWGATKYEQKLNALRYENKELFENKVSDYRKKIESLKEQEQRTHNLVFFENYTNFPNVKNNIELYSLILENKLEAFDFQKDKNFSKKNHPVFSKHLYHDWFIVFTFGNGSLDADMGMIDFLFGIAHSSNKKLNVSNREKSILFEFNKFFPLGNKPFGDVYGTFNNYKELELSLYAYIDMYFIIAEEFEDLITKGLIKSEI